MSVRRLSLIVLLASLLQGCANVGYYAQAVNGQLEVYRKSQPIAEILADPDADPELKQKLAAVLKIREYASRELGLPDNGSYRLYADLERSYVLWNVFATPELSLKPREWCFIVTGCVGYRGYFDEKQAQAFAAKLRAAGDDVYVGGVTAYSTLRWFDDPLLNTVINRPLPEIAGLLFHELAHQRLYVRGDSAFSESFAMTVELEGMRRWLREHGSPGDYEAYETRLRRREEFVALVLKHRDRLEALYESHLDPADKRAGKAQIFAQLRAEYAEIKATRWNGYAGYDHWFAQDLNNAHLVSLGMYHRHVPAFQNLLARHEGDLLAFYRDAESLGDLPPVERVAALEALTPTATATLDRPGVPAAPQTP
ncbi:MAG TPA: aminopeptidase [Burkholderiales bacterium]